MNKRLIIILLTLFIVTEVRAQNYPPDVGPRFTPSETQKRKQEEQKKRERENQGKNNIAKTLGMTSMIGAGVLAGISAYSYYNYSQERAAYENARAGADFDRLYEDYQKSANTYAITRRSSISLGSVGLGLYILGTIYEKQHSASFTYDKKKDMLVFHWQEKFW